MTACVIMHSIIIEDEHEEQEEDVIISTPSSISNVEDMEINETDRFRRFVARHKKIKHRENHFVLQNVLIEHLWERYGNEVM